jgi:DME family drug/metabolite transporter
MAVILYQLLFFAAIDRAGVGQATIVAIGSGPIWAGLIEATALGRQPGVRWMVATALAISGITLLVLGQETSDSSSGRTFGLGIALLAGLAYSLYAVIGRMLIDSGQPPERSIGLIFGMAAIFAIPVLLARWPGGIDSVAGMFVVLYLGVVPTAIAYLLFGIGLRWLAASTVTTIVLAETVVAAMLGLVVLDEAFSTSVALGATLVLFGLAALAVPSRARATGAVTG